ncbi:MAG TPA: S53 family peptidase [Polyangia bacterium]|jgi:subtilase family serine protease|nr:S53 family peptidase [Polyangia bacterium]
MLLSGFGLLSACSTSAAPTGSVAQASNGNRPAWAVPANLVGRVAPDERITVQVQLALHNQAQADAELAAIADPDSAVYGQFLTDEQFNAKYAPTADDVAAVQAHLESAGLDVKFVPENRAFVSAEGTAVQIEKAFSTQLGLYKAGDAVKRAPITAIAIPAALQSRVSSVMGLFQPTQYGPKAFKRGAMLRASAAAMVQAKNPHPYDSGGPNVCSEWFGQVLDTTDPAYPGYAPLSYAPCGYKPGHIREGYGFTQIIRKGNDGTGQKIAIVDAFLSPTLLTDAQTYAANNDPDYPLRASQLVTLWGPGQTQTPDTGWYGEQTLDVEAAHAMAPGATIVAVAAQSATDQDLIGAINLVVSQRLGSVISNSYGMVEQGGYIDFLAWKPVLTQAGLKGIGVYFSSGDSGDESQGGFFGPSPPSADFPASSDLVTAVGGTSMALGQTGNLMFEVGWETGASFLDPAVVTDGGVTTTPATWDPAAPGEFVFGAGGGWSTVFEQPKWQKGVVPDSFAVQSGIARRSVPDVGMLADPFTGFIIGETDPVSGKYSESAIGGTSLACPLFAATIAVAQQHAKRQFGFVNPLLYKHQAAFRDIVPTNPPEAVVLPLSDGSVAAIPFDYSGLTIKTAAGWDSVTGLGVPNGQAFISAIK